MDRVAAWLQGLGLERYASNFAEHDVDGETLRLLTERDLEKLGVSLGHRRKLLQAIAVLNSTAAPAPQDAISAPLRSMEAERRQLTVLFCDLVGSTELSSRLDPEDLRELIGAYRTCAAETMTRFGGYIAQYLGDGVLVYFGYPAAGEDDAERAVRAGLEVVSAVTKLDRRADAVLRARVGIATGLVVVGEQIGAGESAERAAVGQTPNLAARLQGLAQPGEVIVAASTRRLIGRLFVCESRGSVSVKGVDQPVEVWRVSGEGADVGRFEALRGGAMTPLVGREAEIASLLDGWKRARQGSGRVVLMSGEPGIGKSRLIAALLQRIEVEPEHNRLRYFCSPQHSDSALYPILARLERAAGFAREDPPGTKLDKLEALLAATSTPAEDATLLADLLSIPTAGRFPALNLTPQLKRERTLEALLRQVAVLAQQRPLFMVFEDVHWIDPSSRDLLDLAVRQTAELPALLVITCRPEFRSPHWAGQAHVTTLELRRLDRGEGAAMVDRIARNKPLPREVSEQIIAKTDGVPLFVEELTKMVLESGLLEDRGDRYALAGPLTSLAIPATLQDSLMARLDRLAPIKQVAQIGAAIGREFSYDLLAAVAPVRGVELQQALQQLVDAGLIFRGWSSEQARYAFKHALVQDAAYQTLLRSTRQHLHARIAGAIEEQFPEAAEAEPELLARHCTEATLIEKAVGYRLKAGMKAIERSALVEAAAQLNIGLELVKSLPEGLARDQQELGLQVAMCGLLGSGRGYGATETGQTLARAHELCERTGDTSRIISVLFLQSAFHLTRPDLGAVRRVAQDLQRRGREQGNAVAEILGSHQLGAAFYSLGEFNAARFHLEDTLAIREQLPSTAFRYVPDPGVTGRSWLSWVLYALGYPDESLKRSTEALTIAKELANVNATAFAINFHCFLMQHRRDRQAAREWSETLISLCTEQRIFMWLAQGNCVHGWALAGGGEPEAGLTELHQGIANWRATGHEYFLPHLLTLGIAAQLDTGKPAAQSLESLREALSITSRTEEHCMVAELHRLKGECLSQTEPDGAGAELAFMRALENARTQGAKMWELRAATSLARLWRDQGKRDEARDLLATVHAWFTEGLETPDLQEASRVLGSLQQ